MTSTLRFSPHLSVRDLEKRYQRCTKVDERERLLCVLLKLKGRSSAEIAELFMHKEDWVRCTVRRTNARGPEGWKDGRAENGAPRTGRRADGRPLKDGKDRLESPPDDGGLWSGPKAAAWIRSRTGKTCTDRTGWA